MKINRTCKSITEAFYFCPQSDSDIYASPQEALDIKVDFPDTKFYWLGRRVYPKNAFGKLIFALWPGQSKYLKGTTAAESACHRIAKEELLALYSNGRRLQLQPIYRGGRPNGRAVYFDVHMAKSEVGLNRRINIPRLQPDILLKCAMSPYGNWLALELRNTHEVDYRKRQILKRQGIPAFEIDVRGFANIATYSEENLRFVIREFLQNTIECKKISMPEKNNMRNWDDEYLNNCIRNINRGKP